jgi:hypothetical protein
MVDAFLVPGLISKQTGRPVMTREYLAALMGKMDELKNNRFVAREWFDNFKNDVLDGAELELHGFGGHQNA